jgi:hypothetical protein
MLVRLKPQLKSKPSTRAAKAGRYALGFVALALASTTAPGPAGAQTGGTQTGGAGNATGNANGGNPTAPPAAAGAQGDPARVGFQRKVQLSPQDQVAEGERMLMRMELAASAIRRQLEQARAQRDVVKTLCLNDKLSQVDVAIRSARDRNSALKTAASRNDSELSNHEFTILTVLRQRAEQLTAEANRCIGEESAFVGDTKITTTIDPTLPVDDSTAFPTPDPTLISEPPKCTSCSR